MDPASFLVLIAMFLLTLAIIWYRLRVERWKHEERMAMIEKGVTPPQPPSRAHRYSIWGQLFLVVGLGVGLLVVGYGFSTSHHASEAEKFQTMQRFEKERIPRETLQRIREDLDREVQYDVNPSAAWFALLPCTIGIGYLLMARMERNRE